MESLKLVKHEMTTIKLVVMAEVIPEQSKITILEKDNLRNEKLKLKSQHQLRLLEELFKVWLEQVSSLINS